MKIIYLVSYYFAPLGRADGVNRTYLIKYLSECGWEAHVITGIKYRSLILNFQLDHALVDLFSSSVKIHRFVSDKGWLTYDVKRLLGINQILRKYWINDVKEKFSPDKKGVLMAVVPPLDNAYLAYELAQKYDFPLALYYPDDVLEVPQHIFDHAAVVFCVTPEIKKSLLKKYGEKNIHVIEHGYAEIIDCPVKNSIDDPIKIAYAGSFNFRTKPEVFLRALSRMKKLNPSISKKIQVDFYGPEGYYYYLFLKRHMSDRVSFKGYLPFSKLMNILPQYDLALTVNHANIAFPSKVFHYLNAGLPIFAITEHSGLTDFVKKNNIGITSSLNEKNITQNIQKILSNKIEILHWRSNVMKIREQFQMKNRIKQLSEYMEKLF